MSGLIEEWVTSPWFQLSGFAVGVLGVAIAIIIWAFTRRYKRIWYEIRSFTLVERERSTLPGLQVLFDRKPVDALTISKVCIWNSGKDAVRQEDLASVRPLKINVGNKLEILEASIMQVSSKNCSCRLERAARNSYQINCDFLDPNHGLVVQVAHTGTASEDVSVTGHIVGGGRISRPRPIAILRHLPIKRIMPQTLRGKRVFAISLMVLGGVFMILTGWMPRTEVRPRAISKIVPLLLGLFYIGFAWSLYRIRPPKGLERYEDEFQGADFTKGSFRFDEAPQFASRKEAADWIIKQAQNLAAESNAKFKPTIVADNEIDLDLGSFYWLTLHQISEIIALGEKHGFKIRVHGSSNNPLIPAEWYKNR